MRWGPRIPPRLFALALIPIAGVAFFATQDIRAEMHATAEARALLADADSLEMLWHASVAVDNELVVAGVLADSIESGTDPAAREELLASSAVITVQRDIEQRMADLEGARGETDWVDSEAVARLLASMRATAALRQEAERGTLTTGAVWDAARLADVDVIAPQVARLREIHELEGVHLMASLAASGASASMVSAAGEELRVLASYLAASEADQSLMLPVLTRYERSTQAAVEAFGRGLLVEDRAELVDLQRGAAWSAYERQRDAAIDGATGSGTGQSVVEAGLERLAVMESFSDERVDGVAEEAAALERAATGQLRSTVVVALVVLGFTAIACVVTARTIVRPLRRLEDRARSIGRGELERSDKPRVGPADIVAVESAIDSLTDNLVVLERQAAALATGELTAPVLDEVPPGQLGQSIQDSVQELRRLNSRLDYEANHDALTGLVNRAAILSHLEGRLTGQADTRKPVAVIMADLDGFKHANDTMGHQIGDELLCHVADRLARLSKDHRVGRLGGDEFMVVVDCGDEAVALDLAGRIVEALRQPYSTTAGVALLSAGAGIAWSTGPAWLSPTEVLMRADLALREAKQSGSGELVVFDQRLHDRQFERVRIQGELRLALERDEFQLHFQPIVDISSCEPVGVEALLRWHPPGRPPVPPSVFIPAAEQSELIVDIDNWVVEQACRCLEAWQGDPVLDGLRMSVNVSGRHLSSTDLIGSVRRSLESTAADPELLIIEATETELIPNLDRAVHVLERLKGLGVTLAIDDFGTGYASVAHLRRVAFGELKIDRTFIANLESDTDRSIADLLVSLGRDLDLDVVAEGIETADQLAWARAAGCTHAQGYLLARPGPEDVMRERIAHLRAAFSFA